MTNYLPGTIGHELDELIRKTETLPWWLGFRKWSFRHRIARVRQRIAIMKQEAPFRVCETPLFGPPPDYIKMCGEPAVEPWRGQWRCQKHLCEVTRVDPLEVRE